MLQADLGEGMIKTNIKKDHIETLWIEDEQSELESAAEGEEMTCEDEETHEEILQRNREEMRVAVAKDKEEMAQLEVELQGEEIPDMADSDDEEETPRIPDEKDVPSPTWSKGRGMGNMSWAEIVKHFHVTQPELMERLRSPSGSVVDLPPCTDETRQDRPGLQDQHKQGGRSDAKPNDLGGCSSISAAGAQPGAPRFPSIRGLRLVSSESSNTHPGLPMNVIEIDDPEEILVAGASEWEDVIFEVALDSGSVVNVCSKDTCPGYVVGSSPGSLRGQKFLMGDGGAIRNKGQCSLNLTDSADTRDIRPVFQIADVTRPLMSAGRLCDAGCKVELGHDRAIVRDKDGLEVCLFTRQPGGLYVASMKLKAPTTSFRRQE